MTYQLGGGKQYLVIAAGGHSKFESKRSDSLVAFALPE
jgi:quinoprotein glucose dehydrogenase